MTRADLFSRRKLLIGLALAGTAAVSELYVPQRGSPKLSEKRFEALFPTRIGPWSYLTQSGLILPPEDQLSRMLYERLLTRVYGAAGDAAHAVMMVLAYSSVQEGRLQVHRPEVCYPAAGFTIVSSQAVEIPIPGGFAVPAKFLIADRGARRECILYWTRVGPNLPRRWFDQRLTMAEANLAGYIPDGLLARVSIVSTDADVALATLTGFVRELIGSVGKQGRAILLGPH